MVVQLGRNAARAGSAQRFGLLNSAPMFSHPNEVIAVAVIAVLLLGLLAAVVSRKTNEHPYESIDLLLTPPERKFFVVLHKAVSPDLHVFAKVRLADIIQTKRGLPKNIWRRAFNRICNKHVDFVACHPETFKVLVVIELDDSSHDSSKARKTDNFKDAALAAASIPILRVPTQRSYSASLLREDLFSCIQG